MNPACPDSSLSIISLLVSQINSFSSGISLANFASFLLSIRLARHAPTPCAVVPARIVPSWMFSSSFPSRSTCPRSNLASMSCRICVSGWMPSLCGFMLFSSSSRHNAGSSIIAPGARYIFS